MLKNHIEDNTEKLSFLTVLEEEQLKLRQLLKITPISNVIFDFRFFKYILLILINFDLI